MTKTSRKNRGRGAERYTRRIIVARGDTHAGHDGGLLNPDSAFPETSIVNGKRKVTGYEDAKLNAVQQQLWQWSEEDRANILDLADGFPIDFIDMGDVTQGTKFTDNLQETNLSRQVLSAVANARPWVGMKQVVSYSAVKGTGVHVFGDGSSETLLTVLLKKEYPKKNISVASHYMINLGGFMVDVAHHGVGVGMRVWTASNSFDAYLKSMLWQAVENGRTPPHMVLRAHYHDYLVGHAHKQKRGEYWETYGYITPSYCFIGSHGEKAMKSPPEMSVGTVAFEIINGQFFRAYPFLHTIDLLEERIL